MTAASVGKSVGRVSIRVLPDTNRFRERLKRDIQRELRGYSESVKFDKARVDMVKIREDLRRQVRQMPSLAADVRARVMVDRARLNKKELRESIQRQFDKFENIRVNIEATIKNAEEFQREVKKMVRDSERNRINLTANVRSLAASAHMKWLSRDRFVTFFVKVSKASVAKAAATLAALSGARLAWKWTDDLIQFARDLDKNLPKVLGWTTGVTSLFAALSSSVAGVVGVGQGLFAITPALLTLPGLIMNAAGSVTVLVVALRKANKELAPLKSSMTELGDIINDTFWKRARKPIIDLVQGLMPQLRRSFRDLSAGVGDFTKGMSEAFAAELDGGRLESIFRGIADGWRELAKGAPGFAGAMVSLSQIAATYTPRLSRWITRQADTFDAWLKKIATDGRLSQWMEGSIRSMYDLWDAVKGVSGVFEGLYTASAAAGYGGLRGFADLMLAWERTTKSADFQKGLTAVFRGSKDAMSAFGDGIKGLGRLVSGLDSQFERFIGGSGKFIGGLIESLADALNSPRVGQGLDKLTDGLLAGLEGLKPSLQPIADTFGDFLGMLGKLTETTLPAAGRIFEALMPSIEAVMKAIEPALEPLANAAAELATELGPAIADAIKEIDLKDVAGTLADAVKLLTPVAKDLLQAIKSVLGLLGGDRGDLEPSKRAKTPTDFNSFADSVTSFLSGASEFDRAANDWKKQLRNLTTNGGFIDWPMQIDAEVTKIRAFSKEALTDAEAYARAIIERYQWQVRTWGQESGQDFLNGLKHIDLPSEVATLLNKELSLDLDVSAKISDIDLEDGIASIQAAMDRAAQSGLSFSDIRAAGAKAAREYLAGLEQSGVDASAIALLREKLEALLQVDLTPAGQGTGNKFVTGFGMSLRGIEVPADIAALMAGGKFNERLQEELRAGSPGALATVRNLMLGFAGELKPGTLAGPGGQMMEQFIATLASGSPGAVRLAQKLALDMKGQVPGSLLTGRGAEVVAGFSAALAGGALGLAARGAALASAVKSQIPSGLLHSSGVNIALGMASGIASMVGRVAAQARALANAAAVAARTALAIHSPSKVFKQIGIHVGDGFILGLKGSESKVRSTIDGLITKVKSGFVTLSEERKREAEKLSGLENRLANTRSKATRATLRKQIADSKKKLKEYDKAINGGRTQKNLLTRIAADNKRLVALAKDRDKLAEKIKDAKRGLEDALSTRDDYAASIRERVNSLGDISGRGTAAGMVANLKKQVANTKQFRVMVDELRKRGLDKQSLGELMEKFAEDGQMGAARALLNGGDKAIREVAALRKQLDDQAKALGVTAGSIMHQAGVDTAMGLLKGLQSQDKALVDQATKIAKSLVAAVKKELKIKSPSRVTMQLGQYTGEGMAIGIDRSRRRVDAAMRRLVTLPTPSSPEVGVAAAQPARGAVNLTINNPVTRDPLQDARDAAGLLGVLV